MKRSVGWALLGVSLTLQIVTAVCYVRLPDRLAAFTVLPVWTWGALGMALALAAHRCLRSRWPWFMLGLWLLTLLLLADEARIIRHLGNTAPQPGPAATHDGKPVLRIVTLNCSHFTLGDPTPDLAAWHPDIVLLQEVWPHQARQIATALFGNTGDCRWHATNGVATRGKIQREVSNLPQRDQQVTVVLPDGSKVEVVNVHLLSAITDVKLWRRATWRSHHNNRIMRSQALASTLAKFQQTTDLANTPCLVGGDFNAVATDAVHRQLSGDFTDAFAAAGSGWGGSFRRDFPLLRIDLLYANRQFTPVRCTTVTTRFSDHRMVVADLVR